MSNNATTLLKLTIQEMGQKAVFLLILIALVVVFGVAGCGPRSYQDTLAQSALSPQQQRSQNPGRFQISYVADQIDGYYRGTVNGPIGVTTLVNLDDLYATSTFGRMYAESLMSELAIRGFDVVELRHSDALQFLTGAGEFALSRDLSAVRNSRDLAGVVVGTYVDSPVRVYVNVRLLDPATSVVMSAATVEMDKTRELDRMMRVSAMPASLERIPVKHLGARTYPLLNFPSSNENGFDIEENLYAPPPAPRVYPQFQVPPAASAPRKWAPKTHVQPQIEGKTIEVAPNAKAAEQLSALINPEGGATHEGEEKK